MHPPISQESTAEGDLLSSQATMCSWSDRPREGQRAGRLVRQASKTGGVQQAYSQGHQKIHRRNKQPEQS